MSDLGGKGRVQGPGCLLVVAELGFHRPYGDGCDDATLGQWSEVPTLLKLGPIAAGSRRLHAHRVEERTAHGGTLPHRHGAGQAGRDGRCRPRRSYVAGAVRSYTVTPSTVFAV